MSVDEELDIKLKDGKLTGLTYCIYCVNHGCPTCGYGEEYVTELELKFSDSIHDIQAELATDKISLGTIIMVFCNNVKKMEAMTQEECSNFLRRELIIGKERRIEDED